MIGTGIIGIQRQMRELGRIRTGQLVAGDHGKRRPARLDTFRLTSPTRTLIEAAADVYGGTVSPWDQQWEVVTGANALDIIVPPGMPATTWYELWTAAGCSRRCDGVTNTITMVPCECPPDVGERVRLSKKGEACKSTTRLAVILPRLPDLGVWRLESHSFYAARELAGAVDVLAAASSAGRLIPARLRIEARTKTVPGQPRHDYSVPIIEFVDGQAIGDLGVLPMLELEPGERRIPPLPTTSPPPPGSDLRGPLPVGITDEQLKAGLADLGIPLAEARLIATDAYGPDPLTPSQRADFLDRLRARAASAR